MRNRDPFMPWNDPLIDRDPFAPHNDPIRRHDVFEPWNDPLASVEDISSDDLREYERYGWKP